MDSHTFLACKLFGLCVSLNDEKWPLTLLRHGYSIHAIECSMRVKGGNVSPDAVFTNSKTGHALVIDCKSGANVDLEQDSKYAHMSISDLHRAGVRTGVRSHAVMYAINEEHADRIRAHTDIPLLVFGRRAIYGIGDFGDTELTGELHSGVPLEKRSSPDSYVYTFSIRDAHDVIDGRVSGAIVGHLRGNPAIAGRSLATRADAGAIMREAHPLHALFSGPHRRELRRAVERSIARQEGRGAWWLGQGARRAIGL